MLSNRLKENDNWTDTWNSPLKRRQIIIGSVLIFSIIFTLPFFFRSIQKREGGVILNDWLLAHIPAHNVSVIIFAIIWGTGLLILIRAIKHPSIYTLYSWTLVFVCLARFTSILLVNLAPPTALIPLTDPLTGVFYGQSLITKDLFFSGHTATLTLMVLCLEKKRDRIFGAIGVATVACLLLVQHIHYTVDILAAPIIVYACYRLTWFILNKWLAVAS